MVTRTRDVNDERRMLVNLTNASRAIEADVRGIDGKIEAARQLTESELRDLHRRLEALAHPTAQ